MLPAHIPSPSEGVVHLGPVPIRAYALCIILGVVVAVVVGDRRFQARGGRKGAIADVATWAVPFGLVGARLYHLATNPELYWGRPRRRARSARSRSGTAASGSGAACCSARSAPGSPAAVPASTTRSSPTRSPRRCRSRRRSDGWGNWFNQELYGRPTGLPWGAAHRPGAPDRRATPASRYYQPTFLYESIWDVGVALVVICVDRRWHFTRGRAFALYVALYTFGRGWIESLRIDDAHKFFGLRLNDWTSVVVFLARRRRTSCVRPAASASRRPTAADARRRAHASRQDIP